MKKSEARFEEIGQNIGRLVQEKNEAYGDSFRQCGDFLKLLFPDGIRPEKYQDMLGIVRVFDKLKRIATAKDAFGENPWNDVAGYGILGVANNEATPKNEANSNYRKLVDVLKDGLD